MTALQEQHTHPGGNTIELAYFGASASRITTPAGLTLMLDPQRNPPWGNWVWFLDISPACRSMSAHPPTPTSTTTTTA